MKLDLYKAIWCANDETKNELNKERKRMFDENSSRDQFKYHYEFLDLPYDQLILYVDLDPENTPFFVSRVWYLILSPFLLNFAFRLYFERNVGWDEYIFEKVINIGRFNENEPLKNESLNQVSNNQLPVQSNINNTEKINQQPQLQQQQPYPNTIGLANQGLNNNNNYNNNTYTLVGDITNNVLPFTYKKLLVIDPSENEFGYTDIKNCRKTHTLDHSDIIDNNNCV
jgi:hypothetical protein